MNAPTTKELLDARLQELIGEKADLKAKTADLKAERERLIGIANDANAKVNELTEQILAIERPAGERGMIEILQETSAVATARNGLRMGGQAA